jgi:hypothetical protein
MQQEKHSLIDINGVIGKLHRDELYRVDTMKFRIDAYVITFDSTTQGIHVSSNTNMMIKLDGIKIEGDGRDNDACAIVQNGNNPTGIHVARCLVDSDYKDDMYINVQNVSAVDVFTTSISFKITTFFDNPREFNIHTFPLFYVDEEDLENDVPTINGFKKSTAKANGLDVIMSRNYKLQPLEELQIPCKFFTYTSTLDYQNLFMMRSRFAREGVSLNFDTRSKILYCINHSYNEVYLGNCFFQLFLPTPLCFRIDQIMNELKPIIVVKHCLPNVPIYKSYKKLRQSKDL